MSSLTGVVTRRRTFFFVLGAVLALLIFATLLAPRDIANARFCSLSLPDRFRPDACGTQNSLGQQLPYFRTLGVASSIYVVSLARRTDRRQKMELIREALGLQWQYEEALDKQNSTVDRILHSVDKLRRDGAYEQFAWSEDRALSSGDFDLNSIFPGHEDSTAYDLDSHPLFCAVKDNIVPVYPKVSEVPLHLSLSRGMVACWYSHLQVMWRVAQQTSHLGLASKAWDGKEGVAIVFEDDIDVEWGLKKKLENMWADLPRDWDIVFLGENTLKRFIKSC